MLSATAIAQARPKACQYKLWDERGLYLLVMPNGGRYWRFNYCFAGKRETISLGVFPDVGLAVARDKREEARRLLATGEDPGALKREKAIALRIRQAGCLDVVADEYVERLRLKGRSESTIGKNIWLLDHVRPDLGRRLMSEITAPELLAILRKVEARGRYETANRLRSILSSLFCIVARLVGRWRRDVEQAARAFEMILAPCRGEQAIVADAVEPTRQGVEEEAADELVGGEGHDLLPSGAGLAVVLVAEGDPGLVEPEAAGARSKGGAEAHALTFRPTKSDRRAGVNLSKLSAPPANMCG